MDTAALKKFAQSARRSLVEQVATKMRVVLAKDSLARREHSAAVSKLEALIQEHDEDYVVEKIAYIWFNRFSALRFMDVNHYTSVGIVSPVEGQSQPEILAEAKMGHIDPEIVPPAIRQRIQDLLGNKVPSANPQAEAYRLLLVAACNTWYQAMPFLFQKIDDYTELLLPEDLLSEQSILTQLRSVMTEESCQDVEIIGWLYQFYISEKKDEVFDGLKKNKKITPENIPAATQLFTPHWIVRYLVENSLGRLWMLNHPYSGLAAQMDYYIKPEKPETDFLKIGSPEEIKICDPACGSGHMLVYAFDLLYAIYEEEGYDTAEIPAKILTHNLYGIEIDERAGELAAFALTMKARSKQRNFFRQQIRPNVCVLENVQFEPGELKDYMNAVGRDFFTMKLQNTLQQFEEADNFGSLIRPDLTDVEPMVQFLNAKNVGSDLFLSRTHLKVMKVLEQTEYLRSKYHVVVANPPYMGGSSMNARLSNWVKDNYPDSKSDLFAIFIERNFFLARKAGMVAMITMQSWMFLSSFEKIRIKIIDQGTILSMAHLGARAFDSIGGEVVSTTSFVLKNQHIPNYLGLFLKLIDGENEARKDRMLNEAIKNSDCDWLFRANADDYKKIPGAPIAYWVSGQITEAFINGQSLGTIVEPRQGMATTENKRFLRRWNEVAFENLNVHAKSREDANLSGKKWFPYNKGGNYRKWFGNNEYAVNYKNDGAELKSVVKEKYRDRDYAQGFTDEKWDKLIEVWVLKNQQFYFLPSVTWTYISSSNFGVRASDEGFIFDVAGSSLFPVSIDEVKYFTALLCSKLASTFLMAINPTMNFQVENIAALPILIDQKAIIFDSVVEISAELIEMSRADWDTSENSWNFKSFPLTKYSIYMNDLANAYMQMCTDNERIILNMKSLEEKNNKIFIEAYGLQDELSPEIPLSEITLTCNPHYRYGGNKTEAELEALLLADTMREFISYAVGCMFGRYSLDKPGLVLANQGETLEDYLAQIPSPTFMPDEDNVIPILDGEWFADDIVDRFRQFLRVTLGDEHFAENLKFIEDAIGKDIRSFFLKDFYSDHIKRYKKRPIYWLFSSPKGTFNALIYMYRYRPDTVSIVLNKYLREFKLKLSSRIEHLNRLETSINTSKADKTRAIKEREALKKNLDELDAWERDVLFPLALEQKEIDLDDGVKANYPKFGAALKRIPGLDAAED